MTKPSIHIDAAEHDAGGAAMYSSGAYFTDPNRHGADAEFKASRFLSLLSRSFRPPATSIERYIDVGSGSGDAAKMVARGLRRLGFPLRSARGYDVSPHVRDLPPGDGVEFIHADFLRCDEAADLITLFDVIEHIADPLAFLKALARRARIVGLHIPLDDSWNTALRDLFRWKVKDPGHLVFMDAVSALNLLAFAGFRVVDYEYTLGFHAPSGRATGLARLAVPLRSAVAYVSPWLLSKTLGGASLMVVALTPLGVAALNANEVST